MVLRVLRASSARTEDARRTDWVPCFEWKLHLVVLHASSASSACAEDLQRTSINTSQIMTKIQARNRLSALLWMETTPGGPPCPPHVWRMRRGQTECLALNGNYTWWSSTSSARAEDVQRTDWVPCFEWKLHLVVLHVLGTSSTLIMIALHKALWLPCCTRIQFRCTYTCKVYNVNVTPSPVTYQLMKTLVDLCYTDCNWLYPKIIVRGFFFQSFDACIFPHRPWAGEKDKIRCSANEFYNIQGRVECDH